MLPSPGMHGNFTPTSEWPNMRSKEERQAWWASLPPAERDAWIERRQARKEAERAAHPSYEVREATARLDLATEQGCFMRDIPAADVAARMQQETR